MPDLTSLYMNLKPKKFKFNNILSGYDRSWHYGLMAQDVEHELNLMGISLEDTGLIYKVDCEDGFHEKDIVGNSKIYKLDKNELHALHIQMIQRLKIEFDKFVEKVNDKMLTLEGENAILKQHIQKLEGFMNVTSK